MKTITWEQRIFQFFTLRIFYFDLFVLALSLLAFSTSGLPHNVSLVSTACRFQD